MKANFCSRLLPLTAKSVTPSSLTLRIRRNSSLPWATPKELQKHTISRGIACEECHGEGGHLVGNTNNMSTNCDRCHQRLNFIEDEVDRPDAKGKLEKAFNAKTKSSCPSCGTEGAQLFMSKHYEKGYALRYLPRPA